MNIFQTIKPRLLCSLFLPLLFFFGSCARSITYFDYVSELRDNIFLAQNEDFSLRVYSSDKETPYSPDGVKRETSRRAEVFLVAPSGEKNCELYFTVNDKKYGGEMSFDNVRAEYYFFCSADISTLSVVECEIIYGESRLKMTACSVLTPDVLSPQDALQTLLTAEPELFSELTDQYGFAGEIYIRLLYEDSPYYYIGVMDRNGNSHAFLLNAQTGKILAKRHN